MDDIAHVCDYLFQERLISTTQKEGITAKDTRLDKAGELLRVVRIFSPSGFDKFIDTLDKTSQSHLAEPLRKSKQERLVNIQATD